MGGYGETSGHQRHGGGGWANWHKAWEGQPGVMTSPPQAAISLMSPASRRIEGASPGKERLSYWRRGKHPPPMKTGLRDSSAWWGGGGAAQREGAARSGRVRDSAAGSGRVALCQCPELQGVERPSSRPWGPCCPRSHSQEVCQALA